MGAKRIVRSLLEASLRHHGYELRDVDSPARGYKASLDYAKSRGLSPQTVFDIGVGSGTPWLYDAFPEAKLVLFEPLVTFAKDLDQLASSLNADVHRVALGKRSGTAQLNRNCGYPTSSSLLDMDPGFAAFAAKFQREHMFTRETVAVETLDKLNCANRYEPPYLLKLDVEGGEMEVLEGARETLMGTQFILTEISVMHRQVGEPSFARMISFLDSCGFELFDIPMLSQSKGNGQLVYLDAAFVPKDSELWPTG